MDPGDLIAGYGAGVATLVALRQLLSDFPRVLVKPHPKSMLVTPATGKEEETYSVTVTNAGRRPVQIRNVGTSDGLKSAFFMDWIHGGHIPFTLGEGEYRTLYLLKAQQQKPIPDEAVWVATDSIGRVWPRPARYRFRIRRLWNRLFIRQPGE